MQGGSDAISEPGPNESFDALIDLLGSDDVVKDPRFDNRSNDGLRDADGKLHFGKIHTFFSQSGGQDDGNHHVPRSSEGLERQSETHRPSHNIFEVDKSPVEAALDGPVSPQNITADEIRTDYPLDAQMDADYESISVSPSAIPAIESMEMEALTRALRLANAEVVNLRRQCDNLRSLVHGHASIGNSPPDSPVLRPIYSNFPNSSVSSLDQLPNPTAIVVPPEVADLTENQARQALASILRRLSLPSSCLLDEANSEAISFSSHRPANITEVQRALNFVIRTDEVVWRRSVHGSTRGWPAAAVFDGQNIEALNDRLTLWERVVRGSRL